MAQCWEVFRSQGLCYPGWTHGILKVVREGFFVFFCQSAFFHEEMLYSPENPEFKKLSWKQTAGLTGC